MQKTWAARFGKAAVKEGFDLHIRTGAERTPG